MESSDTSPSDLVDAGYTGGVATAEYTIRSYPSPSFTTSSPKIEQRRMMP